MPGVNLFPYEDQRDIQNMMKVDIFPHQWKQANVTPTHNKKNE